MAGSSANVGGDHLIEMVAPSTASVLITGKWDREGLVARNIHLRSKRSRVLIAINCSAIPETQWKADLRTLKKAFTGALERLGCLNWPMVALFSRRDYQMRELKASFYESLKNERFAVLEARTKLTSMCAS
jgi:hypothetical protein